MGAHGGSRRGSSRATVGTVLAGSLGVLGEILFFVVMAVVEGSWFLLTATGNGIKLLWNRYVRGDKRSAWQRAMDNVRSERAWRRSYECRACGDEWEFHVLGDNGWQCSQCALAMAGGYDDPPAAVCRRPRPDNWTSEPYAG